MLKLKSMLYSYKFRLNPNKNQEILLNKHFGCARFIYNYFLRQRIDKYQQDKQSQNYYDNALELPILKKQFTWLKEVGSQALQYSIKCLQQAYENFFTKCKNKTGRDIAQFDLAIWNSYREKKYATTC